jgi:hypothetical protein
MPYGSSFAGLVMVFNCLKTLFYLGSHILITKTGGDFLKRRRRYVGGAKQGKKMKGWAFFCYSIRRMVNTRILTGEKLVKI